MGLLLIVLILLAIFLSPFISSYLITQKKHKFIKALGLILILVLLFGIYKSFSEGMEKLFIVLACGSMVLIFFSFFLKERHKRLKSLGFALGSLGWAIGSICIFVGLMLSSPDKPNGLIMENKPISGKILYKNSNPLFLSYSSEKTELLKKYLARSKKWKMTRIGSTDPTSGVLVALRRVPGDPLNQDVLDNLGYVFGEYVTVAGPMEEKTMVCFEPITFEDSWREGSFLNHNYDQILRINQYTGFKGEEYEYFILKFKDFSFESFERGGVTKYVPANLDEFKRILKTVLNAADIESEEMNKPLVEDGSIMYLDDPKINITQAFPPGRFLVSGYVNPMEEGFIQLNVLDLSNGKLAEISKRGNAGNSIEYVGWSKNRKQKFYYELGIEMKNYKQPLLFSVMFFPANGSSSRSLIQERFTFDQKKYDSEQQKMDDKILGKTPARNKWP